MERVFLSHSSRDRRQAVAVKQWLIEQELGLAEEIFLDLDPHTGLRPGERWKQALNKAVDRCEAVICLLSKHWEASHECKAEYRHSENLGKKILCARLEPMPDTITSEWQHWDLFPEHGPTTDVDIGDGEQPVVMDTMGLQRLLEALRELGIGADHFPWPPPNDPDREPYRGWAPLEEADAAVFFGRDAQILRGMDVLRRMRGSGVESLFVILGPSGAGKSSFLRAGLLPRLRHDNRSFLPLPIVRPERAVLTGELGLAHAIHQLRTDSGLPQPMLGEIKSACHPEHVGQLRGWLEEARQNARDPLLDVAAEQPAPTLVLPVDQAEELFNADAGPEAARFLQLLAALVEHDTGVTPAMVVALTIRADRYEPLQIAPQLAGVETVLFDHLKPMAPAGYTEVITGPARRASDTVRRLTIEPALVERLLADTTEGADALPLLALTLERLYHDFGDDGDLTLAEYESMGGMDQIVQKEIETVLRVDTEQRQAKLDILHDAFIPWLATINRDSDQPMRRVARWDDELPTASHPLIQQMVDQRLLVKDTRDGQVVVEVALESLLRQWRELAAWLRDEAQDLKDADSLEREANDWQANDRDESWLLREGTRLQEAENLAAKPRFRDRLDPTRDYLQASRERENDRIAALRKRNRILVALLAVTAIVAVVAVALGLQANHARKQADERFRESTALRLAAEAQSMLSGDRPGGDVRGLQQLLSAHALAARATEGALFEGVVGRQPMIKVVQTAENYDASGLAFTHDGRRVITATKGGTARVWDTATGQPVGKPMTLQNGAMCVAISPDGQRVVSGGWERNTSGGWDGTIQVFDVATGRTLGPPTQHTDTVFSVAFSPDGQRIATGTRDGTVRVLAVGTGQPLGQLMIGPDSAVNSVVFSPDGRWIAAGISDGTVQVWDPTSAQEVRKFSPESVADGTTVQSVAFSPDGRWIVAGTSDGRVRVWDEARSQLVVQPVDAQVGGDVRAAFSPDGQRIVLGGSNGTVRMWDVNTNQPIGQPRTGNKRPVANLAFSPDGQRVFSGYVDGTVRVWDAVIAQARVLSKGDSGDRMSVAMSADGQRVIGYSSEALKVFDVIAHKPVGEPITDRDVESVALSRDGQRLVSGRWDGTLQMWNVATGQPIGQPMTGPQDSVVQSEAFSADGRYLVSGGNDGKLRVWDPTTGKEVHQFPLGPSIDSVRRVAFSPDGERIVAIYGHLGDLGPPDTAAVWDVATGKRVGEPTTAVDGVSSVAFSPDGQLLVSVGDTLRVWNVTTGQPVGQLMIGAQEPVEDVAFSADGQYIVSGGLDGTVQLWDAISAQPVGLPLVGHERSVVNQNMAFRVDAQGIVSAGHEGSVLKVAFSVDGQRIVPAGNDGSVLKVAFSVDGQRIVSAGDDGRVRVWPGHAAWRDNLCAKLTTNMSQKQWRDWVSPNIDYIKVCPDLPVAPD